MMGPLTLCLSAADFVIACSFFYAGAAVGVVEGVAGSTKDLWHSPGKVVDTAVADFQDLKANAETKATDAAAAIKSAAASLLHSEGTQAAPAAPSQEAQEKPSKPVGVKQEHPTLKENLSATVNGAASSAAPAAANLQAAAVKPAPVAVTNGINHDPAHLTNAAAPVPVAAPAGPAPAPEAAAPKPVKHHPYGGRNGKKKAKSYHRHYDADRFF